MACEWLRLALKKRREEPAPPSRVVVPEPVIVKPVEPSPTVPSIWRHPSMNRDSIIEYENLYKTCAPGLQGVAQNDWPNSVLWGKRNAGLSSHYKDISDKTRVPVYVIGVIHMRESSFNFSRHLHNGDPLTARTVQVPKGRPVDPPLNGNVYTFTESAIDALRYELRGKGINPETYVWDVANTLFFLEMYNGAGYRRMGLRSPYLWGLSNHQQRGKYVADGKFDRSVWDTQPGVASVLKSLNWQP